MKLIIKLLVIIILISSAGCRGDKAKQKEPEDPLQKTEQEDLKPAVSEIITGSDNYGGKGDRIKKVETVSTEKKTVKTVKNYINTDENMVNSYFLLSELSGKSSIGPEDFEIGTLYSGDDMFREVSDIINEFFGELKKNNLKKELFAESNRFYLGKIFEEYIKSKNIPDSIRIGEPLTEGEDISVSLRFLKNGGKTEGEIVIIKKSGSYFIKGFEGDLSLLDSEKAEGESNEKYEPEIYRFN